MKTYLALACLLLSACTDTPIDPDALHDEATEALSARVIDVMLLYTPQRVQHLRAEGQWKEKHARETVYRANKIYAQNHVAIRFRLVHVDVIDREQVDLGGLEGLAALPQVQAWRETYRADLVSLFYFREAGEAALNARSAEPSCLGEAESPRIAPASLGASAPAANCVGTGHLPNDLERSGRVSPSQAFSMMNQHCSNNPPLVFVHELGHNLGLAHSRAMDHRQNRSARSLEHGFGYGVYGHFSTIMGYPAFFAAPRIAQFSNPRVSCPGGFACGVPIGERESADAAAALSATAPYVAGFYASEDGVSVGPQHTFVREENLLANPTFEWIFDEAVGEFVVDGWHVAGETPYDALLLPGEILDLDRRVNEVEIALRASSDTGIAQSIEPQHIAPSTRYALSMLALLPSGDDESTEHVELRLVVTTVADDGHEQHYEYEVAGDIDTRRYRRIEGVVTTDAFVGTVVHAELRIVGPAPEHDLAVVRPAFAKL